MENKETKLQEIHSTIVELQDTVTRRRQERNLEDIEIENKIAYLHQLFNELKNDNEF